MWSPRAWREEAIVFVNMFCLVCSFALWYVVNERVRGVMRESCLFVILCSVCVL